MTRAFLILFSATILFAGCDDEAAEKRQLAFSVQSDFSNDEVEIVVNGLVLLKKTVSTNHSVGADLTAQAAIDLIRGGHRAEITVNSTHKLITNVILDTDLYIGVNYDRDTNEISVVQSPYPFAYD
jgi:hypothetical protein